MKRQHKWTLNFRLLVVTALITIPILLVLLWMNRTGVAGLRAQKLAQSQVEVTSEISQIDTIVELLDISLINLTANNPDFRLVASTQEKNLEFWRANQRSKLKISNLSDASTLAYTVFAYYPKPQIFINSRVEPDLTYQIREAVDEEAGLPIKNHWNTLKSSDTYYTARVISYETYYVGAFLTYDSLMKKLGVKNTEDIRYYFISGEGQVLNGLEHPVIGSHDSDMIRFEDRDWYIASDESVKGDFGLIKLIGKEQLDSELPRVTSSILIGAAVVLVVLTIFILGIYFWVISPMNHMKRSMAVIEAGDMTYRIPEKPYASVEFENARVQFNTMMDQLEQLKIVIYEGKLERQETKLQYLSQQIQPHFILNSLNTLYNYCDRDPKATKEMILLLSRFYRYVVNINSKYVSLGQELEHIENYLQLQKVRFPKAFVYEIHCDESLEIVPVPPFIIESFVVNAMKYGLVYNRLGRIIIDVTKLDEFRIQIRISDNGDGFSEDVLECIDDYKSTGVVSEELGVGLKNAIERLKLIYKDDSEIRFYNQAPTGAVVEMEVLLQNRKEANHGD